MEDIPTNSATYQEGFASGGLAALRIPSRMTTDMPNERIQIAKATRQGLAHHSFSPQQGACQNLVTGRHYHHAFHRFLKPIFWPVRFIRFAAPSTNDAAFEQRHLFALEQGAGQSINTRCLRGWMYSVFGFSFLYVALSIW